MTDAGVSFGTPLSCRVLAGFYRDRGYKIGDVISDEEAEAIVEAGRVCDGVEAGKRILSYADNSVRGLAKKLKARGFDRDIADMAAEELSAMGMIKEDDQIERRGRVQAERKLRGRRRVAADLCALGYDRVRVEKWLAGCGIDFGEICARAIMKRGGVPSKEDRDERRRLLSYLYRQGFSSDDIRHAVEIIEESFHG